MWNQRAEDLWGLRGDEVRGRSFLGLDIGLPVAELRPLVRACLAGEADTRELTVDATNRAASASAAAWCARRSSRPRASAMASS
jgi:two-component system CheB/CheR fusion protein